MIYWDLFIAMARAGVLGFGGGPGSIPLIRAEVVERFGWVANEEFADILALGNTLPGPIATKLAAFIGYKQAGAFGALASITGMVAPTAIAIIILAKFYVAFKDSPRMEGMLKAVRPVVVILLVQVTFEIAQKSFPDITTYAIAAITAVAMFYFKVHPAYMIVAALLFGAFILN